MYETVRRVLGRDVQSKSLDAGNERTFLIGFMAEIEQQQEENRFGLSYIPLPSVDQNFFMIMFAISMSL